MRRVGIDLLHDANDFFEFGHGLGPVLQSPGGVHQHYAVAAFARHLDRIESEGRGVGALFARDHRTSQTFPPYLQLFDRCGAKRIAGGEQDTICLLYTSRCV